MSRIVNSVEFKEEIKNGINWQKMVQLFLKK